MIAWGVVLVGVAVAQGLVPADAGQAAATSVLVVQGRLTIHAGTGATNQITVVGPAAVGQDATYSIADRVPIMPGTGCQRVTETRVSCAAGGIGSVSFSLGDGADSIDLDVRVPAMGSGGSGSDGIWGGSGDDTVSGGTGDDSIYGNGGFDTLYGGDDADILYGGSGSDMLFGDSAASEPSCLVGPPTCFDSLYGQSGDDYLDGGESGDSLFGGSGTDTLYEPNSGANALDGGLGDDTIIGAGPSMRDMAVYDVNSDVGVNLSGTSYNGAAVTIPAGAGGELAADGTLAEQDLITGVDNIRTGAGDDTLIGAGDNPVMQSGTGTDQCDPDGDDGVDLQPCA